PRPTAIKQESWMRSVLRVFAAAQQAHAAEAAQRVSYLPLSVTRGPADARRRASRVAIIRSTMNDEDTMSNRKAFNTIKSVFLLIGIFCFFGTSAYPFGQDELWVKLNDEGKKAYEQGQYPKAEEYYLAALKELQKSNVSDGGFAILLNNLAELYKTQGKYDEAERLLRQSIDLQSKEFGAEHHRITTALNNLAGIY